MEPSTTPAPYGHACTNCSKAKTKCILRSAGNVCERCHRLRKQCTPTAGVRKRGSKRGATTTSRTTLEEKLDGLVALIQSQNSQKAPEKCGAPPTETRESSGPAHPWIPTLDIPKPLRDMTPKELNSTEGSPNVSRDPANLKSRFMDPANPTPITSGDSASENLATLPSPEDAVPRNADEILEKFRAVYLPFFPYFYIPEDKPAAQLLRERPLFFLVIRSICCRSATMGRLLGQQIRETIARRVIVESERSIDLLLGLLTYLGWSMLFAKGKPYMCMLSNMASSIAHDLHLHKVVDEESIWKRCDFPKVIFVSQGAVARTNEGRRALLGCFINSCIVSSYMKFDVARWRPPLEDTLTKLWEAQETPQDKVLVACARIMSVVDEASQLSQRPENPHSAHPPLIHIPALIESLNQVKNSLPSELQQRELVKACLHSAETFIYALAFLLPAHTTPHAAQRALQARQREHLWSCLAAAQAFLDTFSAIDAADLLGLSSALMLQFAHGVHVLHQLARLDAPGWDRAAAHQAINMSAYLERMAAQAERAHAVGLATHQRHSLFGKVATSIRAMKNMWLADPDRAGHFSIIQMSGGSCEGDEEAAAAAAGRERGGQEEVVEEERGAGRGGGGGERAACVDEIIDPIWFDFTDDRWLTEVLSSWDSCS